MGETELEIWYSITGGGADAPVGASRCSSNESESIAYNAAEYMRFCSSWLAGLQIL